MKRRKNKPGWIIFALALILSCGTTQAQISFSVSNKTPKYIDLVPIYENNFSKSAATHFTQWLNYITLMEYHEPGFSVSLQMVSKRIPQGLKLEVQTGPYQGLSKGEKGTPTGKKLISHNARELVDNITTCYTGSGRGEGHKINLTFSLPNRITEDTTAYQITLVYTLTQ